MLLTVAFILGGLVLAGLTLSRRRYGLPSRRQALLIAAQLQRENRDLRERIAYLGIVVACLRVEREERS